MLPRARVHPARRPGDSAALGLGRRAAARRARAPSTSREPIEEEHASERSELAPVIHLHVETGRGGKVRRTVLRDDSGNIVASEEEPVEGDE